MKTPSQDLFSLIKSLSKTEKRYFKKFSELHGKEDNTYLLLFDAIAKQKEFNEEELKRQFKGHAFVRQFPVAKNYLFSKILDALEFFHRDSSVYSSVRRNIYRAELLQKKGLYDSSMKMLSKAKQDATKNELFYALQEIYSLWEFNVHIEKYDLVQLSKIHDDILQTSSLLNESMICRNMSLQMVNAYYNYYGSRNKKFLEQAEKLMKHPYFKNPEKLKTFAGKLRIYEAKFFFHYAIGNLEAACSEGEKAVKLLMSSPEQMNNNIKMYIVLLSNLFYLLCEQKKYYAAYTYLCQMQKASPFVQTYSQRAKFFYLHDNAMLYYLYHTGKIKELEKKLAIALNEMEIYKDESSNFEKTGMLTNISISYYYCGDLKKCIQTLNTLRNEYNEQDNAEAFYFINIFYLIVHYDAKHYDILHYLVQSFQRFLKKRSEVSKLEIIILNFLKKITKTDSEAKQREEFIRLKNNIETIPPHPMHQYIFKFFDLMAWIESKITNKTFLEIIKEKAAQQKN